MLPSGKRSHITNWKDPPCYSWENPLFLYFDWAMASIAFLVCLPDVIYQHAGRTWSLFCSTVDDLPVNPEPFFVENSWPVDGLSTKHADFSWLILYNFY